MKLTVVIHQAEEGGYWAEIPSIPGCASQGETYEALLDNIHEAIEGCLAVDVTDIDLSKADRVVTTSMPGKGPPCESRYLFMAIPIPSAVYSVT